MHQGTKFLFCLYSLIGTWERAMPWADLDWAVVKPVLTSSRAGQEGQWDSCLCHCWWAVLKHMWWCSSNSFSGFTALWKPKMRALCRGKKKLHLLSHSSAPPTTRENTSHHAFPWRQKKPLEDSCTFPDCFSPFSKKEDIAAVFPGLAYTSILLSWGSASHHWTHTSPTPLWCSRWISVQSSQS